MYEIKILKDGKEIDNNLLWVVTTAKRYYEGDYLDNHMDIREVHYYYGLKSELDSLLKLTEGQDIIEQADLANIIKIEDIKEKKEELYIPKMAGDIVEYKGNVCRVSGFTSDKIGLVGSDDNWRGINYIDSLKDITLLKSRYYGEI